MAILKRQVDGFNECPLSRFNWNLNIAVCIIFQYGTRDSVNSVLVSSTELFILIMPGYC